MLKVKASSVRRRPRSALGIPYNRMARLQGVRIWVVGILDAWGWTAIPHRQTLLVTRNAEEAARELYVVKTNFVPAGVIVESDRIAWVQPAALVRDPMAMRSKSKRNSKEGAMNSGVIRSAFTTTLALELGYREPSLFREIGTKSERSTELQHPGRLVEDEFACLLGVI
jgi:hypothetical protein